MSRFAATSKIWLAAIAVVALLIPSTTAAAAATPAERLTFTGTHKRDGSVTFRAPKLKGKKVRKVLVRVNGKLKKLTPKHAKRLQRSGVLRLRARTAKRKPARKPYTPPASPTAPAPEPIAPPVLVVVVDSAPTAPAPAAPAPTAPRIDCGVQETLVPGKIPGACWRPYSAESPFNRKLSDASRVHPRSQAYVDQLMMFGGPGIATGAADTEHDWNHPTYYPTANDPTFTIHCTESWGRCPIEGMQIPIPDKARAAGGGDAHMTVVWEGWEYDFWLVTNKPAGGGTISISWGGRTRIDGDGLGSGATAAGYGNLAGVIRGPELAAGRIEHALFMVFRCDNKSYVYPAAKGGSHCVNQGVPTENAFPMGQRFRLAMSNEQIEALNAPAWKKTILRAMAEYGIYFGDTGGQTWGIQFESGATYTSFGMEDPVEVIARDSGIEEGWEGIYSMDLASGVDWKRYLRAVEPCTADGTC